MYPILRQPDLLQDANSRGYGALSDCLDCVVTEELNGEYTLTMKYPKNGRFAKYLVPRNIIICSANPVVDRQAFRIQKVNYSLRNNIVVQAYQLAYDLSYYSVMPFSATGITDAITGLTNYFTDSGGFFHCPFTIESDMQGVLTYESRAFSVPEPSSIRSWFSGREGSFRDVFGGDWEYNLWNCKLWYRRGTDRRTRISEGVNIAEYMKEDNNTQYTHVLPFYRSSEEIPTVVIGDPTPTGVAYNYLTRIYIYDVSNNFDSIPTKAQVTALGASYVANNNNLATDTRTISVSPSIIKTDVFLGDTVLVCYNDEVINTRVIKISWDVLAEKYTAIELGAKRQNIAETIKNVNSAITAKELDTILA